MSKLENLPPELLQDIFHRLQPLDLCRLSQTNHLFRNLVEDDSLWKSLFQIASQFSPQESWKNIYRKLRTDKCKRVPLQAIEASSQDQSFESIENTLDERSISGYWCSAHSASADSNEFLRYRFPFACIINNVVIRCHKHIGKIYSPKSVMFQFGNLHKSPIYPVIKITAIPPGTDVVVHLLSKTEEENPGKWCTSMQYVGFGGVSLEADSTKYWLDVFPNRRFSSFFSPVLHAEDGEEFIIEEGDEEEEDEEEDEEDEEELEDAESDEDD